MLPEHGASGGGAFSGDEKYGYARYEENEFFVDYPRKWRYYKGDKIVGRPELGRCITFKAPKVASGGGAFSGDAGNSNQFGADDRNRRIEDSHVEEEQFIISIMPSNSFDRLQEDMKHTWDIPNEDIKFRNTTFMGLKARIVVANVRRETAARIKEVYIDDNGATYRLQYIATRMQYDERREYQMMKSFKIKKYLWRDHDWMAEGWKDIDWMQ